MSAPAPGSAEWLRLVTASKVAAIIGVSPWDSPRSMWHRMRGELPPVEVTDPMRRGTFLEDGVLAWWQAKHPEFPDCQPQFWATRDDLPWAAATPDLRASGRRGDRPEVVVVDAKTTTQADEWGIPGTDEIPTHYLTSTYWQLAMVPEAARAYVAVLGPFLRFDEYVVERDEEIQGDLIERCRAFYDSLSSDTPPPLDDHVATVEAIRQQRGRIEHKAVAHVDVDLAAEFLAARADEERVAARARLADARLIEAAGNAQYVSAGGIRIARQQSNRPRPIPTTTTTAFNDFLECVA